MNRLLLVLILVVSGLMYMAGCSGESVMDAIIGEPEQEASTETVENAEEAQESPSTEMASGTAGEGLAGTWINEDYNGEGRSAKVVYSQTADGSIVYSSYDNSDGSGNVYEGSVDIQEAEEDSEGRTFVKSVVTLDGAMSWETLFRISTDGSVLEVQSGTETIDPGGPRYSIYYRQ